MRDSLRSLGVLLALVFVMGTWSDVMAQPSKPVKPTGSPPTIPAQKQAQPTGKVPAKPTPQSIPAERVNPALQAPEDEVSEELETVLRQWEQKSAQIKTLRGIHHRWVYNLVFEVEQRSTGEFYLETPDKGRIELIGIKPEKGEVSSKIGKSKKPYRLEEGQGEKWICSGQEVIAVNEAEKTYEIMPLPANVQGENIIKSPLPFLFGMKAAEAKQRYRMKLIKNTLESAYISIVPRLDIDRQNYAEAFVLLEKSTYLPTAVKLQDPSGNLETVYKFDQVKINQKGIFPAIFRDKDPFHPKLTGYKLFVSPESMEEPGVAKVKDPRSNQTAPKTTNPTGIQPAARTSLGPAKNNK